MPRASDFLQSSTINADAVGDKAIKVKIVSISPESTRDDKIKLGIQFDKFDDRKLLLNATNLKTLIKHFGEDYSKWVGKSITLKAEDTLYLGEPTKGVRITIPK